MESGGSLHRIVKYGRHCRKIMCEGKGEDGLLERPPLHIGLQPPLAPREAALARTAATIAAARAAAIDAIATNCFETDAKSKGSQKAVYALVNSAFKVDQR